MILELVSNYEQITVTAACYEGLIERSENKQESKWKCRCRVPILLTLVAKSCRNNNLPDTIHGEKPLDILVKVIETEDKLNKNNNSNMELLQSLLLKKHDHQDDKPLLIPIPTITHAPHGSFAQWMNNNNNNSSIVQQPQPRPRHQHLLLLFGITCLTAVCVYGIDPVALHGDFVYDDEASIRKNEFITNGTSTSFWPGIVQLDYWGNPLRDAASHKSFRPVTTATFYANQQWAVWTGTVDTPTHTLYFHGVNVVLHGIVTGLATACVGTLVLHDMLPSLLTGLLFAVHPVHSEAVSNINGRAELLMALFSLLAFGSCYSYPGQPSVWRVYVLPTICLILSLFSKEQGATTLLTLAVYEFVVHHQGSVLDLFRSQRSLRRIAVWGLLTLLVVAFRYHLNGGSPPNFVYGQNPAGLAEDRFTRVLSVHWVYCLYLRDMLVPAWLAPDWSGDGIPLITTIRDVRIGLIVVVWCVVGRMVWMLLVGTRRGGDNSSTTTDHEQQATLLQQQQLLVAFFCFLLSPFLLSSNLLVTTGFMKADRVLYLPLLGFCLLEAMAVQFVLRQTTRRGGRYLRRTVYAVVFLQLCCCTGWTLQRNRAWSSPYRLWTSAYRVNPRSAHTIENTGQYLIKNQEYQAGLDVLRPVIIGKDSHDRDPSTVFVYCMALHSLDRCKEAAPLLKETFGVLKERRQKGGLRNDERSLNRSESDLLVAKAFCLTTINPKQAWETFMQAVQRDTTNEFAYTKAKAYFEHLKASGIMPQ